MFWEIYRRIERGTKISPEEFKNNEELKKDVRRAIVELYSFVLSTCRKVISVEDDEKLFYELFRNKIIDSSLLQELIDIKQIVSNINEIDDEILHGLLVRIMEDLEELFYSIKKFLT